MPEKQCEKITFNLEQLQSEAREIQSGSKTTYNQSLQIVARQHGFKTWQALKASVQLNSHQDNLKVYPSLEICEYMINMLIIDSKNKRSRSSAKREIAKAFGFKTFKRMEEYITLEPGRIVDNAISDAFSSHIHGSMSARIFDRITGRNFSIRRIKKSDNSTPSPLAESCAKRMDSKSDEYVYRLTENKIETAAFPSSKHKHSNVYLLKVQAKLKAIDLESSPNDFFTEVKKIGDFTSETKNGFLYEFINGIPLSRFAISNPSYYSEVEDIVLKEHLHENEYREYDNIVSVVMEMCKFISVNQWYNDRLHPVDDGGATKLKSEYRILSLQDSIKREESDGDKEFYMTHPYDVVGGKISESNKNEIELYINRKSRNKKHWNKIKHITIKGHMSIEGAYQEAFTKSGDKNKIPSPAMLRYIMENCYDIFMDRCMHIIDELKGEEESELFNVSIGYGCTFIRGATGDGKTIKMLQLIDGFLDKSSKGCLIIDFDGSLEADGKSLEALKARRILSHIIDEHNRVSSCLSTFHRPKHNISPLSIFQLSLERARNGSVAIISAPTIEKASNEMVMDLVKEMNSFDVSGVECLFCITGHNGVNHSLLPFITKVIDCDSTQIITCGQF